MTTGQGVTPASATAALVVNTLAGYLVREFWCWEGGVENVTCVVVLIVSVWSNIKINLTEGQTTESLLTVLFIYFCEHLP